MTKFTYTRFGLKCSEVWFNTDNNFLSQGDLKSDLIQFKESYVSVNNVLQSFKNGIISLERPMSQILSDFDKGFLYEIRKAEKEKIVANVLYELTTTQFIEIFRVYERFCVEKKIQVIPKKFFNQYHSKGVLMVTQALIGNTVLQYHIYFVDVKEIILLASFPGDNLGDIKKSLIGYANRYLHWTDINEAHLKNKTIYNLGGIGNSSLETTKGIVKFKMEMSPKTVIYYHGTIATSLKGNLYLKLMKIIRKYV